MNFASKSTMDLQKKFADSYLKDLKKLIGKCFIFSEFGDDEAVLEVTCIHDVTEHGSFITSGVEIVGDSAYISINEEMDAFRGEPCSRREFEIALERAKDIIAKKFVTKVPEKGVVANAAH